MIKLPMQNRFLRTLLLLLTTGIFAAGCEAPTDLPVDSGRHSYGATANSDLSTYYYPHRAGVIFVYSNKLVSGPTHNQTTVVGSNDTVRTLGFQGFLANDSVFAISITYQVASDLAGRNVSPLRYLPTSSSFAGAYISGTASLQGETTTTSLSTRAVSTDSATAPAFGRMRALASDLAGSGTAVWQTDTVYYTSDAYHVALLAKTASGSFVLSKDLFRADVAVTAGNEWSYSTWQTATKLKVVSENTSLTVGSTSMNAIHCKFENPNLTVASTSEKYFAPGYGQVKQIETFWTTADGVSRTRHIVIREEIVVIDLDEIATL
jgi:hypothetical protein